MNKINYLFLIALFLTLAGCVKTLTDELKSEEPKLVLNAAISPDSSLTVNLSRTFNIFEDESGDNLPFIDSADIMFLENGQYLFNLENNGLGYYTKPGFYPETENEYSVQASYEGFNAIESKTSIPYVVPIHNFDTATVIIEHEYGTELNLLCSLTYNDPPGVNNQYQLVCKSVYTDPDGEEHLGEYWLMVPESDKAMYDNAYGNLLWSDKHTDGREVTARFYIGIEYQYIEYTREIDTLTFVISFQSVNHDYYTYLKSLDLYYETGGGEDPFSEAVIIYSNIENGYGIFGGFSQDTTSINYYHDFSWEGGNK